MRVRAEDARVLITVKTAPQPSEKYGDTVCVAGIRIDGGRHEWVRLYPIAFRWLDKDAKFKKYDIVDLEVRRRDQDTRPESYSPTKDSIKVVKHLADWKARQSILQDVPRTTTCELRREALKRHDAPSLGMIGVASIDAVRFEPHPGWNEAEQRKIAKAFDQTRTSLFGSDHMPPVLVTPRFKFGYRYHCMDSHCPGHTGQLLDWELNELERRIHGDDKTLKAEVTKRFRDMIFAPTRETSFYMGNFEDPKKRQNFSVLGVHYPTRGVAESATLL